MLYSGVHLVNINFVDTLKVISNIQFWHAEKKHNIMKHLIKLWGDYLELKTARFKQVSGQTNKLPQIFLPKGGGLRNRTYWYMSIVNANFTVNQNRRKK